MGYLPKSILSLGAGAVDSIGPNLFFSLRFAGVRKKL